MKKIIFLLFIIVAVVGTYLFFQNKDDSQSQSNSIPSYTVKKGPLIINITESGTIKPKNQIILKNEVQGKTSILWLIPEGTKVKKGDLLVELDTSTLKDQKIDQEIRVQNADASYIGANENFAVVENKTMSDVEQAQLTASFAVLDLKKYNSGEFPNELKDKQSKITLAQEELKRIQDKLAWSEKLFSEKYISESELEADKLSVKKSELDLDLAKSNLELLLNYTYKREIQQLESDVKQSKMALERVKRKAKADIVQAKADLKAKESELNRQKQKLTKIEDQIINARIKAPENGIAIYATSVQTGGFRRPVEPLEEGQTVRERQELIYLPTNGESSVVVAIHEINLDKVKKGLPVNITIEALPGKVFKGRVEKIAPLPDARSAFFNPDLKVYNTEIYIDEVDEEIRTGMNCQVDIRVAYYNEAVFVPVQAVIKKNNKAVVYVIENEAVTPREIETGFDNSRVIHIKKGLTNGERVSLIPPLDEGEMQPIPVPDLEIKKPDTSSSQSTSDESKKPGNRRSMTPEQRDKMQSIIQNMTPEQKETFSAFDKNGDEKGKRKFVRQLLESGN